MADPAPRRAPAGMLELVVAILGADDKARVETAISHRQLQVLDRNLSSPRSSPVLLALMSESGQTSLYLTASRAETSAPDLTALAGTIQRAVANGSFYEGALLVLGQDRPRGLGRAESHYPNLLVELRQATDPEDRFELCGRGLAGLAHDAPSAASAVLWWELGRLYAEMQPDLAVHAFASAALAYGHVVARDRQRQALRVARRFEQARQGDLFDEAPRAASQPPLRVPATRFEVIPAALSALPIALPAELEVGLRPTLEWHAAGEIQLDPSALDHADLSQASLVVRSADMVAQSEQLHEVTITMDLAPRLALGLDHPARTMLRYSMASHTVEVSPHIHFGNAGAPVTFRISGLVDHNTTFDLTVGSDYGQISRLKVGVSRQTRGGNGVLWVRGKGAAVAA